MNVKYCMTEVHKKLKFYLLILDVSKVCMFAVALVSDFSLKVRTYKAQQMSNFQEVFWDPQSLAGMCTSCKGPLHILIPNTELQCIRF
jgi:hypothetical protein